MIIKTKGIVLKHRNIGENDKIVTLLTDEMGLIEVTARRVQTGKSKISAAIQILSYNEFCLYKTKSNYVIDSAETINSFYNIRLDVVKTALCGYFSELTLRLMPTLDNAKEYLKLLLNSLYFVSENKYNDNQIKAVFELKAISISGFMPNLIGCSECNEFEKETMYFIPYNSNLLCSDCYEYSIKNTKNDYDDRTKIDKETVKILLYPAVLSAMRHIIYSELNKIYSFKLSEKSLKQLNKITEFYVQIHTDIDFKSLEIYHSLEL